MYKFFSRIEEMSRAPALLHTCTLLKLQTHAGRDCYWKLERPGQSRQCHTTQKKLSRWQKNQHWCRRLSDSPKMPPGTAQRIHNGVTPPARNVKRSTTSATRPLEANLVSGVSGSEVSSADQIHAAGKNGALQGAQSSSTKLVSVLEITPCKVHNHLKAKLLQNVTDRDTHGMIYAFRAQGRPEIGMKIGCTKRADPRMRLGEHRKRCGIVPNIVYQSLCDIDYCYRLEQLIHLDLANHNQRWHCKCTTIHEEWFVVSDELAVETVKKWEAFMRDKRPYSGTRQLRLVWVHLINMRWLRHLPDGTLTHESRREYLGRILAPTREDYFHAYWKAAQSFLQKFRDPFPTQFLHTFFWQLVRVGISMFVLCRNALALYAFLFVPFCAGVGMLPHIKPGTSSKRSRKSV